MSYRSNKITCILGSFKHICPKDSKEYSFQKMILLNFRVKYQRQTINTMSIMIGWDNQNMSKKYQQNQIAKLNS